MIEPFWWIRSAGVAAVPVSNREPQVSRRDRPTRAAFFVLHFPGTRGAFRDFFDLIFRGLIPRECAQRISPLTHRDCQIFRYFAEIIGNRQGNQQGYRRCNNHAPCKHHTNDYVGLHARHVAHFVHETQSASSRVQSNIGAFAMFAIFASHQQMTIHDIIFTGFQKHFLA